jgi:hypothetical protein
MPLILHWLPTSPASLAVTPLQCGHGTYKLPTVITSTSQGMVASNFFHLMGKDHLASKATFYRRLNHHPTWDATKEQKQWLVGLGATTATSPSCKLATLATLLQVLVDSGCTVCSTLGGLQQPPEQEEPTQQQQPSPSWAPPPSLPTLTPSPAAAAAATAAAAAAVQEGSLSLYSIPLQHPNGLPPASSLEHLRGQHHKYSLASLAPSSSDAAGSLEALEPVFEEFEAYCKDPINLSRGEFGLLATPTFTKVKKNILQFLGFCMSAFNLKVVSLQCYLDTSLLASFLTFLYFIRWVGEPVVAKAMLVVHIRDLILTQPLSSLLLQDCGTNHFEASPLPGNESGQLAPVKGLDPP